MARCTYSGTIRRRRCGLWRRTAALDRDEVKDVSVRIANAELARAVERVVDVFFECNALIAARLTRKRRLRGCELPTLKELIQLVDAIGVEPQAHGLSAGLSVHVEHEFRLT